MSRVRIVCKGEVEQDDCGRLWRMGDATTTHVYAVDDDGTERELYGVTSITWHVACDPLEPARAKLEIAGVEVDVEAQGYLVGVDLGGPDETVPSYRWKCLACGNVWHRAVKECFSCKAPQPPEGTITEQQIREALAQGKREAGL